MKALVLLLALACAAGAYGLGWLDLSRGKHPAEATFEAFYWKVQKGDLVAAGELVVPGSEADAVLAETRESRGLPGAAFPIARGFSLELDSREETREGFRLRGRAIVTVDPPGHASAFGVQVPHDVEARLVHEGGAWRVADFDDRVLQR